MRYNPPYGSTDPDAHYVDRNTPNAVVGSKVPAPAIEHPQREIVAALLACGLTPSGDNLDQLARAIQSGKMNYAIAGGTENALTVTLNPAPAAYADIIGMRIHVMTGNVTNSSGMTLNVNGMGTRSIRHRDNSVMTSGEIPASSILSLIYDGVRFVADAIPLASTLAPATQAEAEGKTNNVAYMTSERVDQQQNQPRANLASAATTNLGSIPSQDINVTGSVTITSFGTGRSGLCRRLTFAGALTLTHSAALSLPNGGSNIVTEAGDSCEVLSLGSGNWVVLSYERKNGVNPVGDRQSWQDVSGSRAASTSYQNTTGRTIMVAIAAGASFTSKSFQVSVNGTTWSEIGIGANSSGSASQISFSPAGPFAVPSGHYYRMVTTDTISQWKELR